MSPFAVGINEEGVGKLGFFIIHRPPASSKFRVGFHATLYSITP